MPKKYREAAAIVVIDGNKFLILKRSKKVKSGSGFWNFPGGSVEKGERLVEGAVRELEEEAGLTVSPKDAKYLSTLIKGDLRLHLFIADKFIGKVKINYESDDYKWITPDESKDFLFVGGGTLDEKTLDSIRGTINNK